MTSSATVRPPVVVVTGGAGFIGCALSPRLLESGARVIAVDCLLAQVHPDRQRPADLPDEVELVVADVAEASTWDELLTRATPDVVIHLAAETGTGQSLNESTRHARSNVVGTTAMLDALARHGSLPGHVVLTSSRAVYGEGSWRAADGTSFSPSPRTHAQLAAATWDHRGPDGHPAEPQAANAATTQPNPASIYGSTKLAQELVLRNWSAGFSVPVSVLRLQNVYGPGQSPHNPYTGIITLFHRQASKGATLDVYEDGDIGRDFVFIDDVVAALEAALAHPPTAEEPRVLDVGTGIATSILEAARTIAAHHGAPEPQISGKFRDGDVRSAWADIQTTQAELGWTPRWGFADGSAAVATWLERSGHLG